VHEKREEAGRQGSSEYSRIREMKIAGGCRRVTRNEDWTVWYWYQYHLNPQVSLQALPLQGLFPLDINNDNNDNGWNRNKLDP
jgi:hypothetical protein